MSLPDITHAIRNVTLIDGSEAPPLSGANVLVSGERIVAAGPGPRVPVPDGVPAIDGTGRWLIPGLVDAHVHVNLCGVEALPLWLANGVTTVRDIGGRAEELVRVRAELAAGTRVGPRLFTHGPMIDGAPSGFRGGALAEEPPLWVEVDGPEQATAEVDRLLAIGVDGFKVYQLMPPETLRALLRRVDGRVPVTGHLTRTLASEAIAAGINCIEHNVVSAYNDICRPEDRTADGAGWHTPGFLRQVHEGWARADLSASHARAFIELFASSGVHYSPTLSWGTAGLGMMDTAEESGETYLPPALRRRRAMAAQRAAAGQTAPQTPDPDTLRASGERQLELISRLCEAGARVLAGTDTGAVQPLIPGFSLHRELRWLVRAGMPPAVAVQRATRVAAEALRRGDDQGTIRPGRRADLLLLDADPLADITNTRRIHRVVKDGRVYDPMALLAACARAFSTD